MQFIRFLYVCVHIYMYKFYIYIYITDTPFFIFFLFSSWANQAVYYFYSSTQQTQEAQQEPSCTQAALHMQRHPPPLNPLKNPSRESFTKENRDLRSQHGCQKGRGGSAGEVQTGAEPPAQLYQGQQGSLAGIIQTISRSMRTQH